MNLLQDFGFFHNGHPHHPLEGVLANMESKQGFKNALFYWSKENVFWEGFPHENLDDAAQMDLQKFNSLKSTELFRVHLKRIDVYLLQVEDQ